MHTICTTPGFPGEFAEQTTWHLATTEDCRKFRYQGEAIARGGDDRPNKNIYTGSVIKKGENEYYAFYTAYNADIRIHGKSVQSVMRASSQDLIHWETDEDFLFVADDCMYEAFDWRDPFVFKMRKRAITGCCWLPGKGRRSP